MRQSINCASCTGAPASNMGLVHLGLWDIALHLVTAPACTQLELIIMVDT
jgi:hypothetical protein